MDHYDDDFELDYPAGEEPIERANRTLDIVSLSPDEFDIFMAGHASGRASGFEDGYAACEARYADAHRAAVEVMTSNHDFIKPEDIG